jgi:hypothetical protein
MARPSQTTVSKTALKNTIVELEDEMARQRRHIQRLEAQTAQLKSERSANYKRLKAEERNRKRLETISRMYKKYSSSTLGTFMDPGLISIVYPSTQREQLEEEWFKWATKELQFATEMRDTFKRVHGSSTGASESTCSKRFCDDSSSGLVYGERKRLRF